MKSLVLSLFHGIGMLDMAFEQEGFCVVRGPDILWGGNVFNFFPPPGRFDGIIGGPPCQAHSRYSGVVAASGKKVADDLIPEFSRVVGEAAPTWFLMENVRDAPMPVIPGYAMTRTVLDNRDLGEEQHRVRSFVFGVRGGPAHTLDIAKHAPPVAWSRTVLTIGMRPGAQNSHGEVSGADYGYFNDEILREHKRLQGLPRDFLDDAPLTKRGKFKVIGNGVPIPMGRAVAAAIRKWVES